MTIGVAILTLNAGKDLPRLIPMVVGEALADRIMVIDSASTDGTVEWVLGQEHVELHQIARADFNHGATRELARKSLGTDIVVFLTQDVLPLPGWLKRLTAPIVDGRAVVSYARQLPHAGADIYEAFPREFNYPASHNFGRFRMPRDMAFTRFFALTPARPTLAVPWMRSVVLKPR
jgi:rhamnosyltransferase